MITRNEIDELIRNGTDREILRRILEEIAEIQSELDNLGRTVANIETHTVPPPPEP